MFSSVPAFITNMISSVPALIMLRGLRATRALVLKLAPS